VLVAGSLPLLALSLTIAHLMGPGAATATVNVLYMLLAFASGLLVPMNQLPWFVQQLAVYLPTYHFAQMGWRVIGVPTGNLLTSVAWLVSYGMLFFASSLWAHRRDANRRFR
jgi:ABC-2 type transport system permease protein